MPLNMTRARALCTKPEVELLEQSTARRIGELTPARLRSKIDRTRKLRNKYRDLAQSQRREARGKQSPRRARPAEGNANTVQKQEFFAEALKRFEDQLAKLDGKGSPAGKTSTRKKASTGKKTARKKTGRKQAAGGSAESDGAGGAAKKKRSSKSRKRAGRTLARAGAASKTARKKTARKKARTASRASHAAQDMTMQEHSESTRGVRARKTQIRANSPKIQGHVSGATRRHQARRDSR